MRLITWNVNSIRARLPRVLELLEQHAPDVVCVQETKVAADTFPHEAVAAVGYRAVERSEGRWNGVALLVQEDRTVDEVRAVLPGEPNPAEARWLEAVVDGIRIASVYVPNGREPDHPMFAEKLTFLDAMRVHLERLCADGPTVVAGDLNVAPEDRDVWDIGALEGATHVTEQERSRLRAMLEGPVIDAYREVEPDAVGYTWWDYRMQAFRRRMGMRIDLALVSEGLTVRSAAVDTTFRVANEAGDKPSDHAPLVVALER
ncbi:MAG: exodeoxyribonuclease III [Nitriliruptoraceae bacterium]|nr:exodeoxyribonuclease III [Nitriliruptoraceae bacterium]